MKKYIILTEKSDEVFLCVWHETSKTYLKVAKFFYNTSATELMEDFEKGEF